MVAVIEKVEEKVEEKMEAEEKVEARGGVEPPWKDLQSSA
jgi:hypothetical protein